VASPAAVAPAEPQLRPQWPVAALATMSVAVFLSVIFFGWLWGGWGLLLGAPLVAIVRTIASRIESLTPVAEFLSDDAHGPAAPAQAAGSSRTR